MNNSHFLMIIFIFHFSLISSPPERGTSISNNNDLDAIKCNYGKHHKRILRWCDCRNVLGNGSHCEIEKLFNSTHGQIIMATVPDHLDSWKKNLETQFSNEKITIVVETKYYVKGFVDNNIYFEIQFLPNINHKKYLLMSRSNFEMIGEIFSKKNNNANVSNEEEMNKGNETSKTNVTKVVKNDHYRDYITWTLLSFFLLVLVLLGFIKLFLEDIIKIICRSTMNRLRLNIENEEHSECEELEFVDVSGNPNAVVTRRSGQAFLDIQKDDENNDIQTAGSSYTLNHNISNTKKTIIRSFRKSKCSGDRKK